MDATCISTTVGGGYSTKTVKLNFNLSFLNDNYVNNNYVNDKALAFRKLRGVSPSR